MELLKTCGVRKVFRLNGYQLSSPLGASAAASSAVASVGGSPTKVFMLQSSLAQANKVVDLIKVIM